MIAPLLAVHISDGVLRWPWLLLGFAGSACLLILAARRVEEAEIPRIGLLTAAFFVASSIRVHVGPTSVHLLLNGLVGVVLGPRAVLAIFVGLLLQKILLDHGGYTSLGVNCCLIALPALMARPLFILLSQVRGHASFRFRDGFLAVAFLLHPLFMLPFSLLVLLSLRRGWMTVEDVDFRAGFVVGLFCVIMTALLNATLLFVAGTEDWHLIAIGVVVAHIPIAFVEGIIVGCTTRFLRKVKPELLGIRLTSAFRGTPR